MVRLAVAVMLAGVGLDVVGHVATLPDLAEVGHLVVLFGMVAIVIAIVVRGIAQPSVVQGDSHAIR